MKTNERKKKIRFTNPPIVQNRLSLLEALDPEEGHAHLHETNQRMPYERGDPIFRTNRVHPPF